MYRSLGDLRARVNQLIETQGEDAGCVAFLYTAGDVRGSTPDVCEHALELLGDCDNLYETIGDQLRDCTQDAEKHDEDEGG